MVPPTESLGTARGPGHTCPIKTPEVLALPTHGFCHRDAPSGSGGLRRGAQAGHVGASPRPLPGPPAPRWPTSRSQRHRGPARVSRASHELPHRHALPSPAMLFPPPPKRPAHPADPPGHLWVVRSQQATRRGLSSRERRHRRGAVHGEVSRGLKSWGAQAGWAAGGRGAETRGAQRSPLVCSLHGLPGPGSPNATHHA